MNSYENFKKDFLAGLAKAGMREELHYQHQQLAQQYDIPDADVRELLIQWAQEGLITISHWDGLKVLPWNEWPTPNDMFFSTLDGGHIRVRLLAAGAALVEDLPTNPIGFITGKQKAAP